jgi:hypothetical protein
MPLTSSPAVDEPPAAQTLRSSLFGDLDRLAFALEMEAAGLIREGREKEADRAQQQRLGVRLAQRLVAGVWADEVDERVRRWSDEYEARLGDGPSLKGPADAADGPPGTKTSV